MPDYDIVLRNLYANQTWYQLNSNYNDSNYWDVIRKISEVRRSTPRTNFSMVIDTSNVIDLSPILYYGSIPCSAPRKEAYMDSDLSCALFQLPYFLEKIQFAYICLILIIPIMLISIFGKIQENYKWFLLNQALWDTFMCYSFICEKPTVLAWSGADYQKYSTCFYTGRFTNPFMDNFVIIIKESFRSAPYIPLFLLAFSRCIAMYFPNFYKNHSKTWKIIAFIVIFDVTITLLSSSTKLLNRLIYYFEKASYPNCFNDFCIPKYSNYTSDSNTCRVNNEKYFQCLNRVDQYYSSFSVNYRCTQISIIPVMFIFVLLCVFLLILKVSLQLKYQLKHNRHAFLQTIKVVTVITIQSITLTFYLILTSIQTYLQIEASGEYITDTTNYKNLSPTMFLLQSFATTTSINIIRIFLDSFIILSVLSGYRKRVFGFFAFSLFCIRNPSYKAIKKQYGRKNNVISIALTKTLNN